MGRRHLLTGLYQVEYWHEQRHGCRDQDCAVVLEIAPSVVAVELTDEMRRNPAAVYCRRRGCGHSAGMHVAAGCMVDGCDCEELRE